MRLRPGSQRAASLLLGLGLGVGLGLGLGPGLGARPAAAVEPPAPAVAGQVALRLVYDDNFIHYSDGDLAEFESAYKPGKFLIESAGGWILRPRLELTLASRRLTGKKLEIRWRASSWYYAGNTVKNNRSYQLRLKHPGFGHDSFEALFYRAPEYYLRSFLDRPPYAPRSQPSVYTQFRYSSTSLGFGYWRKLSRRFDGKLALNRSWRYYNQPFMENDNWEWRFGGYLTWRFSKRLRLRGEYLYSHVIARGADVVGETRDTNSGDLARELTSLGVEVLRASQLPDDRIVVVEALRAALTRADLVIPTGGRGPTPADRTRDASAGPPADAV